MQLSRARIRSLGGLAGLAFAVMALVGFLLPGTPPKATEVAKVGAYLVDKRGEILAGDYIVGVAFVLFLIFVASLRLEFGAADRETRPGAVALAGGVAAAALIMAGAAVLNGAAFVVGGAHNATLNLALYHVSNDLFFMSGLAIAVFFIGAAVANGSTAVLPGALTPGAFVIALLNLVAGIGLIVKTGFFAIGGAFGFIVPLVSILWVVVASVAMLRSAGPSDAPASSGTRPVSR
jgi:hypothetical protein